MILWTECALCMFQNDGQITKITKLFHCPYMHGAESMCPPYRVVLGEMLETAVKIMQNNEHSHSETEQRD